MRFPDISDVAPRESRRLGRNAMSAVGIPGRGLIAAVHGSLWKRHDSMLVLESR